MRSGFLLAALLILALAVPRAAHAGDWRIAAGAGWAWSDDVGSWNGRTAALPSVALIRDPGGVLRFGAAVSYLPPVRIGGYYVMPAVYAPYANPRIPAVEFVPMYLIFRLGPPVSERMAPFVQGGPMAVLVHWSNFSGKSSRTLAGYHAGGGFAGPLAGRLGFEASVFRLESGETTVSYRDREGLHRWVMAGALTWRL